MNSLSKIVNTLCGIPLVGPVLALILAFLPFIIVGVAERAIFGADTNVGSHTIIIGGLLVSAWCFALSRLKIINIVTPYVPIPVWVLGIILSGYGVAEFAGLVAS